MKGLSVRTPYPHGPQWEAGSGSASHAAGTGRHGLAERVLPGCFSIPPQAKQLQSNHMASGTGSIKPGLVHVGRKDERHSELGVMKFPRGSLPAIHHRPGGHAGSGQQAVPCRLPSLSPQTPERMGNVFLKDP